MISTKPSESNQNKNVSLKEIHLEMSAILFGLHWVETIICITELPRINQKVTR